jgi:hypothetical protein
MIVNAINVIENVPLQFIVIIIPQPPPIESVVVVVVVVDDDDADGGDSVFDGFLIALFVTLSFLEGLSCCRFVFY